MSIMDMFSLKGKNALVIGGSKGLGEGIARGLVEAGAVAVVSSRNQTDCDKAAAGITEVIYYSDKYADTDSTIAKVVDVAANSLMIELTGNQNKLDFLI